MIDHETDDDDHHDHEQTGDGNDNYDHIDVLRKRHVPLDVTQAALNLNDKGDMMLLRTMKITMMTMTLTMTTAMTMTMGMAMAMTTRTMKITTMMR